METYNSTTLKKDPIPLCAPNLIGNEKLSCQAFLNYRLFGKMAYNIVLELLKVHYALVNWFFRENLLKPSMLAFLVLFTVREWLNGLM